jgi:hypothetical protein
MSPARPRFLIWPADPGRQRASRSRPYLPAGQLADWGQGIALMTRQLTP